MKIIGTTAILLNRIQLIAVVGGNEVTNPFVVTEVYTQQGGAWKLGLALVHPACSRDSPRAADANAGLCSSHSL